MEEGEGWGGGGCLLCGPRVVVGLHFGQLWELGEELHEPDEEVQSGLLTVMGKDDVDIEVLVDEVDHVGQEVVEGCLEEVSHLGMGQGMGRGWGMARDGKEIGKGRCRGWYGVGC